MNSKQPTARLLKIREIEVTDEGDENMSTKDALFVRTKDKDTAKQLSAEGFELVDDKDGWIFLNKACRGNFDFSKLKVAFTNILHV